MLVVIVFNKYCWAWKVFRGWYVKRPDLRGTWKVELHSCWVNPETKEPVPPITAYAVIRQTLISMSFRLFTKESKSVLIAHSIEIQEADDLYKLVGVYRNEPNIELQGVRSEIHYGAFSLEIHGEPVTELEGHYWTDRGTKGRVQMSESARKYSNSYQSAEKLIR